MPVSKSVRFFYGDGYSAILNDTDSLINWLITVIASEQRTLDSVDYFFISDEELQDINLEFLQHEELTDVITFPYSYDPIRAEIYISVDRVIENAQQLNVSVGTELNRVMVHGLLHMCGYKDKTDKEKSQIRALEDYYLSQRG